MDLHEISQTPVAEFSDAISGLPLGKLKVLYEMVLEKDDELGVELWRPDAAKQDAIHARVAQLIAETDSDYDPNSGEREPDYASAATDYLTRD